MHTPGTPSLRWKTTVHGDTFYTCSPEVAHEWEANGFEVLPTEHADTITMQAQAIERLMDGYRNLASILGIALDPAMRPDAFIEAVPDIVQDALTRTLISRDSATPSPT